MSPWIGFGLDCLIIVLLGATIFYAFKLSRHLKNFRESRSSFDQVILDLDQRIVKAERAIVGLRMAAEESGADLQDQITKASSLADELLLMTESADRVAGRLEELVSKKHWESDDADIEEAQIIDLDNKSKKKQKKSDSYADGLKNVNEENLQFSPFSIRDPEAERGLDPIKEAGKADKEMDKLHSEAEKDLFKALKQSKSKKSFL